jgi:hypothetical protein
MELHGRFEFAKDWQVRQCYSFSRDSATEVFFETMSC